MYAFFSGYDPTWRINYQRVSSEVPTDVSTPEEYAGWISDTLDVDCFNEVDISTDPTLIDFTHVHATSDHPQPIGSFTITNDGDVPFEYNIESGDPSIAFDLTTGTLNPGESETIQVEFDCNLNPSFSSTTITINAEGTDSNSNLTDSETIDVTGAVT